MRGDRVVAGESPCAPVVRIAIVFLLLVLADAGMPAPVRPAEKQPPSVLILNSYHQGYEWSDNEIEGVLEGLRSAYPEITPAIEHLDLKRFPAEDHQARLMSYLSGKYRNTTESTSRSFWTTPPSTSS